MNLDSEFGDILATLLDGSIIRVKEASRRHQVGDIVFVSQAHNPLNMNELTRVLIEMENFKSSFDRYGGMETA